MLFIFKNYSKNWNLNTLLLGLNLKKKMDVSMLSKSL